MSINAKFGLRILLAGGVFVAVLVVGALVVKSGALSEASPYRDPDQPAICVQVEEGAAQDIGLSDDEVAATVRTALPDPEDNGYRGWVSPGQSISVDYGCPGGVRLGCPEHRASFPRHCHQVLVEQFSKYGVFVFVVSRDEFTSVMQLSDSTGGRRISLEVICNGHLCHSASEAFYVTTDEFLESEVLAELLAELLTD